MFEKLRNGLAEMTKRAVPTSALGSSRSEAGDNGYVVERVDRDLNLIGRSRYQTYQEMVRDTSIVAASVRLFVNLIANAVWTVNPPEDLDEAEQAKAQEYADAAYAMLFDMTSSWSSVVKKLAMFRFIGFSLMEWTAKRNPDGSIGLLDIEHRPQQTIIRWLRDPSGTITAAVQRIDGGAEVTLPRGKIVYAVDDTLTDSPEGVGLFRHLAAVKNRLQLFLELEEIGFANDLRGIPVARAPMGEMREDVAKAKTEGDVAMAKAEARRRAMLAPLNEFLQKHVKNAEQGILLPSDTFSSRSSDNTETPSSTHKWDIDLLNGDSNSFEAMAEAIKRMNAELARVTGTEHLLLGQDGGGSLALARSKVGTFYLTVSSTLLDLAEVCDRDVLKPLAELNNWEEHLRPRMGVNEISDRDIEQVTRALADIAQAGAPMMPGDPAVGELYDDLGLTRPPEDRVASDADASLNPTRKDPVDPDKDVVANPEDKVTKRRPFTRGLKKKDLWLGKAFDPNQPRIPKGSPGGGKWTGDSDENPIASAYRWDTSSEGFGINQRIRSALVGGPPLTAPEAAYMEQLDALIAESATKSPTTVYRTIAGSLGKRLSAVGDNLKGVIANPAFLSTSIDESVALEIAVAERNNSPVVIKIDAKGRKGLVMDNDEVLFGRGSVLDIKSAKMGKVTGPMSDETVDALIIEARLRTPGPGQPIPIMKAYDPDQPRDPGGEGGGQWVSAGGEWRDDDSGLPLQAALYAEAQAGFAEDPDAAAAVKRYQRDAGGSSREVNGQLRNAGNDPKIAAAIDALDRATAINSLDGATLYRGTDRLGDLNLPSSIDAARKMIGTEAFEPGFSSTSIFPSNFVSKGVMLEIDGASTGALVMAARESKAVAESIATDRLNEGAEVLLPRGMRFAITGVRESVHPRIVPERALVVYQVTVLKGVAKGYNPDQPRDPGGEGGGQWVSGGIGFIDEEDVAEWVKDSPVKETWFHVSKKEKADKLLAGNFSIDDIESTAWQGKGLFLTKEPATNFGTETFEMAINLKSPFVGTSREFALLTESLMAPHERGQLWPVGEMQAKIRDVFMEAGYDGWVQTDPGGEMLLIFKDEAVRIVKHNGEAPAKRD